MFSNIIINLDDLKSQNWEDVLKDIPDRTCDLFSLAFNKAAREAEENNDEKSKHILMLFQGMTSMMMHDSEKSHPFTPSIILANGSRSAAISDFSDEQLDLFKEWLSVCVDPELKSRIADIIWTRKRQGNHLVAEAAIEAYIESALRMFESEFPHRGVERISRALHLSVNLGRNSSLFLKVVKQIEQLAEKYAKQNSNFVVSLIQLMIEYYQGDVSNFIVITESLATYHENQKNWFVARDSLELKARLHRKMKDVAKELLTLERISQSYIQESDEAIKSGQGYMLAAHHVQSAIEALRRVPNTSDKQRELHRVLLGYQEKSLQEFGQVSAEMDLTKPVELAIEQIKGKTLVNALFSLAMLASPIKKSRLEGSVEEMTRQAPLYSILGSNHVDSKGRIVAQKPSMLSDNPDIVTQAKMAEMYSWALREQQAIGMILHAARLHFLVEHNPTLDDMFSLVIHNPFVPAGRERIYARGLLYGVQGDYLAALHFLLPQLENSIRYVLNNMNIITSGLNSDGIQEEYDLGRLLDMPELLKVFGEDLVFELKGIFVERFGSNYRNLFAHGLLDEDSFSSSHAVYVWCVILRICCLPIILKEQKKDDTLLPE